MKTKINSILKAANKINEPSRNAPGNFIVTSPAVAEAIMMLDIKYQRKKKLDQIEAQIKTEEKEKR